LLLGSAVGKGQGAHPVAIQCPFSGDEVSAKTPGNGRDGRSSRCSDLPGDGIGINDRRTLSGQKGRHGTFAAANATRQPDMERRLHRL